MGYFADRGWPEFLDRPRSEWTAGQKLAFDRMAREADARMRRSQLFALLIFVAAVLLAVFVMPWALLG